MSEFTLTTKVRQHNIKYRKIIIHINIKLMKTNPINGFDPRRRLHVTPLKALSRSLLLCHDNAPSNVSVPLIHCKMVKIRHINMTYFLPLTHCKSKILPWTFVPNEAMIMQTTNNNQMKLFILKYLSSCPCCHFPSNYLNCLKLLSKCLTLLTIQRNL